MSVDWDPTDPGALRITSAGLTACAPDWAWDTGPRPWSDQDLWVVLDGRGRLHAPDGIHALHRGSCFVLRGGERYRGEQDRRARLLVSHTHFDWCDPAGRPLRPPPAPPPLHRDILDVAFLEGLLRRLLAAHHDRPDGPEARRWLGVALAEVLAVDRLGDGQQGDQARRIAAVCAAMRDDPVLTWSVAGQARRCGWHPDHYARVFARLRGCSPQAWAIRLRCEIAAARLRGENTTVARIAEDLGYRDAHFFSRQFSQRWGTSPRRWRQGG